jgi:hypothetical protein
MEQRIKLDLSQATWVKCENGGQLFDSAMMVKRISPILSPTGKEEHLPIEVVICKTCGKVPQFFWAKNDVPEDMKSYCKPAVEQSSPIQAPQSSIIGIPPLPEPPPDRIIKEGEQPTERPKNMH